MLSFQCPINKGTIQVPYYDFHVREGRFSYGKIDMGMTSTFFLITGAALTILAIGVLATPPIGVAACYVASVELAMGITILCLTILVNYKSKKYQLQTLPLPLAKTKDEYMRLLDLDKGNTYTCTLRNRLHLDKDDEQLKDDFHRFDYYVEGDKVKELEEIPKKIAPYFHQNPISDMYAVLIGRYNNESLDITVSENSEMRSRIECFNLEGKTYLKFIVPYKINQELDDLGHIYAQLLVDLEIGDKEITWKSPQSIPPTLE